MRKTSGVAVLLGVLALASACSTPIGVVRGDRHTMYRTLTSSVLSTGGASEQVLNRLGLAQRFEGASRLRCAGMADIVGGDPAS